ncbi:MAG: flagellar hook-length control protein FliK [Clostridia bacterium]|nr:flagellar hook-length control protein FliK [Clostridia bacterium]
MSGLPAFPIMQLLEKPGMNPVKLSVKNSSGDGAVAFKRELEKAVSRMDERNGPEGEIALEAEGAATKKDIGKAELKGELKSTGQGENAEKGAETEGAAGFSAVLGLMFQGGLPPEAEEAFFLTGNGPPVSGELSGALMSIPLEASSGEDATAAAVLPRVYASETGEVLEAEPFLMVADKGVPESPRDFLEALLERGEGVLPFNKPELKAGGEKPVLKLGEGTLPEGGVKTYSETAHKDAETFARGLKPHEELSSGKTVNPGDTVKGTAAGEKASPEVSGEVLKGLIIVKDSAAAAESPKNVPRGGFIERLSMILKEQMVQKSRFTALEGKSEVTLQLKPEYLGRLLVKLTLENNVFHARILAENSHVRQYIRDNLSQLKQSLESQGISWQQTEVDVGSFEQWSSYEYAGEDFGKGGSNKREGLAYDPETSAVEEFQHEVSHIGGTISYLA